MLCEGQKISFVKFLQKIVPDFKLLQMTVLATKCSSKPQQNKFTHFESRCTYTPSFHVEKHQNEVLVP